MLSIAARLKQNEAKNRMKNATYKMLAIHDLTHVALWQLENENVGIYPFTNPL